MITQIGSLPYDSVEKAVAYSLKHDIPFLPELPKLGDSMLDYIKHPGKMSCLEKFKEIIYPVKKVQCVGPATLIQSGYGEDDAVSRICSHLTPICEGLNSWFTYIFLDEPALGHAGFDYSPLWDAIFSSIKIEGTAIKGAHVCGTMDWDRMFRANIDIISFDASQCNITSYPHYNEFRQRGGKIAWGISKPEDVRDFKRDDLITLPCGLGTKSVKDAEKGLELLLEAKELYFP
ncbi:MAG: hypothetical protein KJ955_05785 [Nanoarchaeota archaeon]|nr:hypothetical protein [Nanoarchaeota archaeon]